MAVLDTACTCNGTAMSGWPVSWVAEWLDGGTNATTSATLTFNGTTNVVWPQWVAGAATTNVVNLWLRWVKARASDGTTVDVGLMVGESDEPSELTRRADAQLVANREAALAEQRRHAADERALVALREQLTEEQRAQLERERFFVVRGSAGGEYQLPRGSYGRCRRVEGPRTVEHLCVHPINADFPDADALLAVKLLLEADESKLRKIANITRVAA